MEASLIKAILTGGAYDMSADPGSLCGGSAPNNSQGWGRVDLGQSLYPTNASVMVVDRIAYSDGSMFSVKLTVTNPAPLSVQLAWTDYPGSELAEKAIVNDLDLVVSNGLTGAVWYGNRAHGGDRVNTVESVRLPASDVGEGEYYVLVKGKSVLYDSTEGGAAALYVRGAFSEKVSDSWNTSSRTMLDVRSYMVLSSNKGYRWKYSEENVRKGTVLNFAVPVSVPGKSETIDVSSSGDFYSDEDGTSKKMNVQRLGRIEIAEPGADSGVPVTNETGYMATSFSLEVDSDKDVLFRFYDEASTNAATALPMWWYRRYVEEDPLSGILRFISISPSHVEWVGCADKLHVLERSDSLCGTAQWLPVWQRLPAPVLTNSWPIPAKYSTNSFFRIRYDE